MSPISPSHARKTVCYFGEKLGDATTKKDAACSSTQRCQSQSNKSGVFTSYIVILFVISTFDPSGK